MLLIGLAIAIFFWAVKSKQFDDLDSPAHRILFDDDENPIDTPKEHAKQSAEQERN